MAIPQESLIDITQVKIYTNLSMAICTFSDSAVSVFFSSYNMITQETPLTPLLMLSSVLTEFFLSLAYPCNVCIYTLKQVKQLMS